MRLAVCLIAAALAGCASGVPVQDAAIKVSDAGGVGACKYLDTVVGTSSWYGLFAERGFENARSSAFDKARQLQATHLVWEPVAPQVHGTSNVAAKVYRCA